MRRLAFFSLGALLGVSMALVPACRTFGIVVGSGDLVTRDYDLDGFNRVQADHAFNVEIVQAPEHSLKVTVDDNLVDYLEISKNGEFLILSARDGYSFPNSTFRAQVAMPGLRELKLSGASRASASGFTARDDLKVSGSGASSASFLNMQVGTLEVDFSGASSATGRVDADGNARLELSGASSTEFEGRAQDLNVQASGASRARLGDFAVRDARVNVSGASQATVNPSGTLSGEASGASHISYRGNPTLGNINTSGGSSVGRE
jgi:hypothetical protein